jgi:hypothetical protein
MMIGVELTMAQEKSKAIFLNEFNPHPEYVQIFVYSEFIVVEAQDAKHNVIGKRSIHRHGHTMGR